VVGSDLRVRALSSARYAYPDVAIICKPPEFDPQDKSQSTITNPRVIVEVLSPSTEKDDRGEKFARYILCPSLEEYVLITQHKPRVETFHRQGDGTWSFAYFDGRESIGKLRSLGIELPLTEVYAGVEFPPEEQQDNSSIS
jgi:Uma2 family endonuclease